MMASGGRVAETVRKGCSAGRLAGGCFRSSYVKWCSLFAGFHRVHGISAGALTLTRGAGSTLGGGLAGWAL